MFGVVDQTNWTVCDQDPAPGETVSGTPRLTVDRSCEGIDDLAGDSEPEAAEPEVEPETEAEAEPEAEPTEAREVRKPKQKKRRSTGQASETFLMPALVGANLQDAQDHLQALGSYLMTQNDATGMERFQVLDSGWKVCAQIPAAGATVSVARMIDLRVVKLDESCP